MGDLDGAIWPKAHEPVDPNFSLGVIIWRPAKEVTRALPSTFEEAEAQALKPPAEPLGNGNSVSMYFTLENSHEAFLNVRQTNYWRKVKNDPAFVEFSDKNVEFIPLATCIANRDRPDEPIQEVTEEEDEDEEMQDTGFNVMGKLEDFLASSVTPTKNQPKSGKSESARLEQAQEDILASLGVTGTPKTPTNEVVEIPFDMPGDKPSAPLPEKPTALPGSQ